MVNSMTGFASGQGASDGFSWTWEIRSVNARGLDLRLRVPDWLPGLEQKLRATVGDALSRGAVTLNLRISREEDAGQVQLDADALQGALKTLSAIELEARAAGVTLTTPTAMDLMKLPGIVLATADVTEPEKLSATVQADFAPVLADFLAMRAGEGRALEQIIAGQLDEIESLVTTAQQQAKDRLPQMEATLRDNLNRVLANADGLDEARLAQEIAVLVVKSDVTEEIDRLMTHVKAARALLATDGPCGRKFDFLMQEFNREANTLCSKSQDSALTATGLDLKAVIDQMREQIQNVE